MILKGELRASGNTEAAGTNEGAKERERGATCDESDVNVRNRRTRKMGGPQGMESKRGGGKLSRKRTWRIEIALKQLRIPRWNAESEVENRQCRVALSYLLNKKCRSHTGTRGFRRTEPKMRKEAGGRRRASITQRSIISK